MATNFSGRGSPIFKGEYLEEEFSKRISNDSIKNENKNSTSIDHSTFSARYFKRKYPEFLPSSILGRRNVHLEPVHNHPLKVPLLRRKDVKLEPVPYRPLHPERDTFSSFGSLTPPLSNREVPAQIQHERNAQKRRQYLGNTNWEPYQEEKQLRRVNRCHNLRDLRGWWIFSEAVSMALRPAQQSSDSCRIYTSHTPPSVL